MKKRQIILLSIVLSLFLITLVLAVDNPAEKVEQYTGGFDESTGLPESFSKYSAIADNLSESEARKVYLKREWTKLYADGKLAPIFYYTHNFFSFFNPLWEFAFGMPFTWSWSFFVSIAIWIAFVIILYMPSKHLFQKSPIFGLIGAIVIASLIGKSGVISNTVDLISTAVNNLWILAISILIAVIILIIYYNLMKNFEKDADNEELERAKESIKAHGKASEEAFEAI